jgi:hypothetical protein
VYGIVKQHGSYVAVDSELGRGTTFAVYMSGYPGDVIGKHGVLASGAFVQKPFTPSGLVEKEREVFGARF